MTIEAMSSLWWAKMTWSARKRGGVFSVVRLGPVPPEQQMRHSNHLDSTCREYYLPRGSRNEGNGCSTSPKVTIFSRGIRTRQMLRLPRLRTLVSKVAIRVRRKKTKASRTRRRRQREAVRTRSVVAGMKKEGAIGSATLPPIRS